MIALLKTRLDDHHYQEWKNSGVSDRIIELNVESIHDSVTVDKVLNRNNKKRWKHSDNLVPCWMVAGVDPLSGESTLQGAQVKPDISPVGEDGRILKYLGASQYATSPLFLDTGDTEYWKSVVDDILVPIIITEGAKKAGAGLSSGFATISIPGVSTCRKNGRLHQNLQLFANVGRTFNLCFDNDILHKKTVQEALISLGRDLASKGCKIMVVIIPPGPEKGMDDYIAACGSEKFRELVESALTFEEWLLEIKKLKEEQQENNLGSRTANNFHLINKAWGDKLRYNLLKKTIEFNGRPLEVNHIKLTIALEFDIDISKEDAFTIVEWIAKNNSYSPIVEYLNEVEAKHPGIDTSFLDDLAFQLLGTKDPLHALYFKNFLVAAVARARRPGCWMDVALVLTGEQGTGKSRLWEKLFSEEWFSDDLGNDRDKDEKMKMHRFWCLEWGEFQNVYRKKDVDELKRFLSCKSETFRTPYDRQPEEYKRGFVFVGTTNEVEILNDPTGDRRFWVIPLGLDVIPEDYVLEIRDKIWAAANALYKSGYTYRLSREDEKLRAAQNETFRIEHPWKEIIARFLSSRDYVTLQDIYHELGIEPARQDHRNKNDITKILRGFGWKPEKRRISGIPCNIWVEGKQVATVGEEKTEKTTGTAGTGQNAALETPAAQGLECVPALVPVVEILQSDPDHQCSRSPDQRSGTMGRVPEQAPERLELLREDGLSDYVPAVPVLFEKSKTCPDNPGNCPDNPGNCPDNPFQIGDYVRFLHNATFGKGVGVRMGDIAEIQANDGEKIVVLRCGKLFRCDSWYVEFVVKKSDIPSPGCPPKDGTCVDDKREEDIISTVFGDVRITIEPYRRNLYADTFDVWVVVQPPVGESYAGSFAIAGNEQRAFNQRIIKEVIDRLMVKQRDYWLSKIGNPYRFRVQKVSISEDQDFDVWENCILLDIPNPPTNQFFWMRTPEGAKIPVCIGEFTVSTS